MVDRNSLTAERLREVLLYDPETGIFVWRVAPNGRVLAGAVAGSPHPRGVTYIGLNGWSYPAHRLAWLYITGSWPTTQLDHRDRVKSNNAFSNLRPASDSQNRANKPKTKRSTSGYKGVTWSKAANKWAAQVGHNGKNNHVGVFNCVLAAARAYDVKALELHGEFACLNFPEESP